MDPALEVAAKTHLDERQTVCTSYVEFLPLAAIVPTCRYEGASDMVVCQASEH